jgi:hypothetical protein
MSPSTSFHFCRKISESERERAKGVTNVDRREHTVASINAATQVVHTATGLKVYFENKQGYVN